MWRRLHRRDRGPALDPSARSRHSAGRGRTSSRSTCIRSVRTRRYGHRATSGAARHGSSQEARRSSWSTSVSRAGITGSRIRRGFSAAATFLPARRARRWLPRRNEARGTSARSIHTRHTVVRLTLRSDVRALLACGLFGPPVFVAVFLIEGATRPGYSAWRNYVSSLATGDGGWVQVANFIVWGTLAIAFAIGLVRAGARAVGALLFLYGCGLVIAGVFVTDPGLGYPPDAPPVHTAHGMIHGLAGLAVFTINAVAAL